MLKYKITRSFVTELETSFQDWLQRKEEYLTEDTLKTIQNEWRECELEEEILKTLFDLWKQAQVNGESWKPKLAQKAVDCATNNSLSTTQKRKIPFCPFLAKMVKLVRSYYMTYKDK